MKYWIMRTADPNPLGETSLRAIVRAIREADPVNVRLGGCVESVVTCLTHRRFDRVGAMIWAHIGVGSINASPDSGSKRRCSGRGVSVTTISSVGRTDASMRWPPCAVASALPTTTCA